MPPESSSAPPAPPLRPLQTVGGPFGRPASPRRAAPGSPVRTGPALRAAALALLACGGLCLSASALGGCSNKQKKLGGGGGITDTIFYDVLGGERPGRYYFDVVRNSRDPERFSYRFGTDPYLVDKNVDALQRLGDLPYARLEGQANVIVMLMEVLLEDASALARSAAAVSLTKIGARLPRYADAGRADDGSLLVSGLAELDALYGPARGGRPLGPPERARAAQVIAAVGDARFEEGLLTKKALQYFGTTDALIDEADPGVRQALDVALTRKSREAVVYALAAAVEAPTDFVRADAVRGLRILGEAGPVGLVAERLPVEVSAQVRGESAEYLGRIGSAAAAAALVRLLEDADGSVRWRARQALVRVARQDLGTRTAAWRAWGRGRFPGEEGFEEPQPRDPQAPAR